MKAVATFIGGTPRLATLLGDALLENDPMRAADLLERLIDELTPYYKERIEVLPSRSQALLDTLLRGGERCSATELARRAGAPNQPAIAGPLDELKKDLVVTGEKAPDSAEVLLRVTDRVFAHYYRKRILSHGQEMCPLEALVELLATFYSPDEKKQEAEKLAARGLAREAAILERLWQADQQQRATGVVVAGGTNKDAAIDAEMARWWTAAEEGRFADGLLILDGILKTARAAADVSREVIALNNRAWTLNELRMHEAALTAANEAGAKAVDIDDLRQHALALRISAFSLGQLGRHEEAIETARESVTKAKSVGESRGQAIALRHLAWNLGELGRHIEAIETARKAAAIAEMAGNAKEQTRALRTGAACLRELGRHNEAIEIAREAAVIAKAADDPEEQADAIRNVAISLSNLGRHSEAIATACDAAAIAERAGDTWEQVHIAALLLLEHANLDVEVALKSFLVLVRHANSVAATYPALFFSSIARIATRRMVWPKLTDLLSNSPAIANEIAEKSESLAEPANAIVAAHESGPRESALDETRHLVAALSQAVETATDPRLARLWTAVIHSSADRLATKIDDPDLLRDLANIMAAHPAVAARAAQLLAAAAAYHTAERDPSTLARLDPDLATTLTTVFPPKSGAAKQVRKSQKRKRPKG